MAYCANCGAESGEGARFCSACGQPTPLEAVGVASSMQTQDAPQKSGEFVLAVQVSAPAPQPTETISRDDAAARVPSAAPGQSGGIARGQRKALSLRRIVTVLASVAGIVATAFGVSSTDLVEHIVEQFSGDGTVAESSSSPAGDADGAGSDSQGSTIGGYAYSYSTEKRPSESDFGWYAAGIPADATAITDFYDLVGSWKCLFIYEPYTEVSGYLYDYSNLSISGAEGNFAVGIDWYQLQSQDGAADETSLDDTWLNGEWTDGTLTATGACTITIGTFYEYESRQYAMGTMSAPDGTVGQVVLVRP